MKNRMKVILCIVLSIILVLSGVNFAFPVFAATEMNYTFDTFNNGGFYKGFTRSINTDPNFSQAGGSLRLDPNYGYTTAQMQYALGLSAGQLTTDGIKFWAKSTIQKVTLDIYIGISGGYYDAQVVVTNIGGIKVIPYSSFTYVSGTQVANLENEVKTKFCYITFRYFNLQISTIYIDSLTNKLPTDVPTAPEYGPPDPDPANDPDATYMNVPSEPAATVNTISNFFTLPGGYDKGITVIHNTNPANADVGKSVKIIPSYGYDMYSMQYALGLPKGKITGSGFKFWAKAVNKKVILELLAVTTLNGQESTYSSEVSVDTTGAYYELPFKSFNLIKGVESNFGKQVRGSFIYLTFRYFYSSLTYPDVYCIDSLEQLPYNEAYEAADPPPTLTIPTTQPHTNGGTDDLSLDYSHWNLKWSDEFNGTAIDKSVWSYDYGLPRTGEVGYFTDRPENSYIENGNLVIQTNKENYNNGVADYTSAELKTKGKAVFQFGRMEMRARLPYSQGMWPAFWLLGYDVGWPACGEIDIMELIGGTGDGATKGDNTVNGTLHWSALSGGHTYKGGYYKLPTGDFHSTYHTIGIIWTPNVIAWYVDDYIYRTADITAADMTEFQNPMYIILNTTIGGEGSWSDLPNATTVFPQKFMIDYVRYYQPVVSSTTSPVNSIEPTLPLKKITVGQTKCIDGLTLGSKVNDVTSKITATGGTVQVVDSNNTVVDGTVATGMKVQMLVNAQVVDEATLIVYGDVNGSGDINGLDLLSVKKDLLKTVPLSGVYRQAGSTRSKDGIITALDLLAIKKVLLGTGTIS